MAQDCLGTTHPVHQRERQSRDQGQGGDERGLQHGGANADIAHARRAFGELPGLTRGVAVELDQRGATCGKTLGHADGHLRVVLRGLPLQTGQSPTHRAGGNQEDGEQQQRQTRHLPRNGHHDTHGQRQRHHVGHHAGQGAGKGALGADHVGVESGDQCARAGSGEERQRHGLHMVVHGGAQVVNQTLTDPRGQQSVEHGQTGIQQCHNGDSHGQPHHGRNILPARDGIDHAPREDRCHDSQHSQHHGDHDEQRNGLAMRAGESQDALNGGATDSAPLVLLTLDRAHHDPVRTAVHTHPATLDPQARARSGSTGRNQRHMGRAIR